MRGTKKGKNPQEIYLALGPDGGGAWFSDQHISRLKSKVTIEFSVVLYNQETSSQLLG